MHGSNGGMSNSPTTAPSLADKYGAGQSHIMNNGSHSLNASYDRNGATVNGG